MHIGNRNTHRTHLSMIFVLFFFYICIFQNLLCNGRRVSERVLFQTRNPNWGYFVHCITPKTLTLNEFIHNMVVNVFSCVYMSAFGVFVALWPGSEMWDVSLAYNVMQIYKK